MADGGNSTPSGRNVAEETASFDDFDELPKMLRDALNYAVNNFTIGDALEFYLELRQTMPAERAAFNAAVDIAHADMQDINECAQIWRQRTGTPYPHVAAGVQPIAFYARGASGKRSADSSAAGKRPLKDQ